MNSAIRQFVQRPGFSATLVLILALGIGANAAVFSAVRSVVLAPLPFPESERLVRVIGTIDVGGAFHETGVFPRHYLELEARARSFASTTAHRFRNLIMTRGDEQSRMAAVGVTAGWSETIGVVPIAGRAFDEAEYEAGADAGVVILAHDVAQRLSGDPAAALGTEVQLNGRAHTVIGVMPQEFNYPYGTEAWLPQTLLPVPGAPGDLNVSARLRNGVTVVQAVAELTALGARISSEAGGDARRGLSARTFADEFPRDPERTTMALFVAVGFLLLLVCVNAANLQLARAASRTRELAVRTALGATRLRQVRDLTVESAALAAVATIAGVAFAFLAQDWLALLVPARLGEVIQSVSLDGTVLAFTAVIGVGAVMVFGFAPAWQLAGIAPANALKHGGRGGSSGGRWMRSLVVAQVVLAFLLLLGAALTAQTFARLLDADVGYEPDGVYLANVALPEPRFDEPSVRAVAVERLEVAAAALPGVESAAATSLQPIPHTNSNTGARILLPQASPDEELPIVNSRLVTPGYLETLGVALIRGRALSSQDTADAAPVAVVSRELAARLWPGEDPVGKQLRTPGDGVPWHTVVGVVEEVAEPNFAPVGTMYRPYAQAARYQVPGIWSTTGLHVLLRAPSPPTGLLGQLREAAAGIDASMAVTALTPMNALLEEPLAGRRAGAVLFGGFGVFALLLATLGTYAVVRLQVIQREREFGIRLALGLRPFGLHWLVVRDGFALIGGGLVLGCIAAVVLAPATGLPLDRAVVAAIVATLLLTGLAACWIPARRAGRIDPIGALRHE